MTRSSSEAPLLLDELETVIRRGASLHRARQIIQELRGRRLPGQEAIRLARLARVGHMPEVTVQLLHHLVRAPQWAARKANDFQRAEYASALDSLGALHEAWAILERIDVHKLPRTLLYRAFIHMQRWEWEDAVPLLETLLVHAAASRGWRLAARLNLGVALVAGHLDYRYGERVLEHTIEEAEPQGKARIVGVARLHLAQARLFRRDWDGAGEQLATIEREYPDIEGEVFGMWVAQWRSLLEMARPRAGAHSTAAREAKGALARVRERFQHLARWSDVLSCDYYAAEILRDRAALVRLYFAVPHPGFRRRVTDNLGGEESIPLSFDWVLGEPGRGRPVALDVANGQHSAGTGYLKEGQLLQRLLAALASDLYTPATVHRLHESLYPKTFFDPVGSPDRVHQAILRLRAWFSKNRIPLRIEETGGFYRLAAAYGGACALKLKRTAGGVVPVRLQRLAASLKKSFGSRWFLAREAAPALKASERSTVRWLSEALARGVLERSGKSSATRYRLVGQELA